MMSAIILIILCCYRHEDVGHHHHPLMLSPRRRWPSSSPSSGVTTKMLAIIIVIHPLVSSPRRRWPSSSSSGVTTKMSAIIVLRCCHRDVGHHCHHPLPLSPRRCRPSPPCAAVTTMTMVGHHHHRSLQRCHRVTAVTQTPWLPSLAHTKTLPLAAVLQRPCCHLPAVAATHALAPDLRRWPPSLFVLHPWRHGDVGRRCPWCCHHKDVGHCPPPLSP
ncbi:uncharacterized protein LOC122191167 [Lagopus leucura]|uniref:uncharacterized protein LOC122191167 n=1 Tax=Lagopus leucura TaxID=30410 RepID=UPI001C684F4B|nr:uncharacterized protein LOC122191167 [Lagopus leucura]